MSSRYGVDYDVHNVEELYETPGEVTRKMLSIARLYGFFPEDTEVGEIYDGHGLMSRVMKEENHSVIVRDKFLGAVPYDFYDDPIPEGINLIMTKPPFRGKREFFRRLGELGSIYSFFKIVIEFITYL